MSSKTGPWDPQNQQNPVYGRQKSRFCHVHLLSSIWHPLGSLLGSLFAPKMAENSLGFPFGAAKSRPRVLFFGPGALQERSKRPPGALQEASRMPRGSKRVQGATRGRQEGARGQRREDEQRSCWCHTCFQGQEIDRHQTESHKALSPLSVHSRVRFWPGFLPYVFLIRFLHFRRFP